MTVDIRELQAHLSEYVRRAGRGEQILVTVRGKPVARLVSLGSASIVEPGVAEGWIIPPTEEGLKPIVPVRASRSTSEVLDEDRG